MFLAYSQMQAQTKPA